LARQPGCWRVSVRTVKYTSRFRRDYRREQSGRHGKTLDADLMATVDLLAADRPLPRRYFDHPLAGEWKDHRDCHIKPDLLLIYRKPDASSLELVRLGSHSELGF
jgi:mRNA interferase YafQ